MLTKISRITKNVNNAPYNQTVIYLKWKKLDISQITIENLELNNEKLKSSR